MTSVDLQGVATLLETCDMAMSILLPRHRVATSGEHHPLLETTVTILLVPLLCDVTMMTIECEALHLLLRPLLALTTGEAIIHQKKDRLVTPLAMGPHRLCHGRRTIAMIGALLPLATDMLAILQVPLLPDLEVLSAVPFPEDEKISKDLGGCYLHSSRENSK